MADMRVTCITKSTPQGGHEHITHLGGSGWYWTREQVIASIDANTNTFYVQDARTGKRADVGIVKSEGKRPYVRTYADGYWNDNLLSLSSC